MSEIRDALRKVCADFHVGALVDAINHAAQSNTGRLPGPAVQLGLRGHDLLLSLGLAERSEQWDMDDERRAVWQAGHLAKPIPTPAQVDALATRCVGLARREGEHATVQYLLRLADDPGLLAEVLGRLAAEVAGRRHS